MKHALFSMIALAALAAPLSAHAAEKLKPYGEWYNGPKNLIIEIAYFEGDKEALVAVNGVNSKLDGKVLRAKLQPGGTGKDFLAQVEGKPFVILTTRKAYGSESVTAYLPESGDESLPLSFDSEKSKEENPSKLFDLYERQSAK